MNNKPSDSPAKLSTDNPSPSLATSNDSSRVLWLIMGGLVLWSAYHAVGLLLTTSQKETLLGVERWWRPAVSASAQLDDRLEQRLAEQNVATSSAEKISERVDIRKPLVLMTASLSFLAFWGLMLRSRSRRQSRQRANGQQPG